MSQEEKTENKEQTEEKEPMSPDLQKCIKDQVGQGKSEEEAKSFCEKELSKLDEEPKEETEQPTEEKPKEPVEEIQPEDKQPQPPEQPMQKQPPEQQPQQQPQQPPEQQPMQQPQQPPEQQPMQQQPPQQPGQYQNFETCVQSQLAQGMNNKDAIVNCAVQALQTLESQGNASMVPNTNGTYNVGGVEVNVGEFPGGFEDCVKAMKSKGMDKDGAISKCQTIFEGKITKQATAADYIQIQEANKDKLYIKAFLLDPSTNLNHWGVNEASLDERIRTFVGRPLILTEDFGHPDLSDMALAHMLQYQDLYRVGTIIDVVKTAKSNDVNAKVWYAICEVTDEKAKEAFRNHKLPLFVSPAVAHQPGESNEQLDGWFGVHLALVNEPAFGVKKAMITGTCSGEPDKCVMTLRQAKIDKYGYGNCGFCIYEKLVSLVKTANVGENNIPEKVEITPNIKDDRSLDSSLISENTQEQLTMSQNTKEEKDQTKVETKVAEEVKKVTSIEHLGPVEARLVRFETENTLLKQRLDSLNDEIEGLRVENAKLSTANRRAEIAGILTAELIPDETERIQLIDKFTASNVTPEMVLAMHSSLKTAFKSAKSYDARTPLIKSARTEAGDTEGRMLSKDIRKYIIRGDA